MALPTINPQSLAPGMEPLSCDNASWTSFLAFQWLNPLVETGVERQLALSDVPPLAASEDTVANARLLCSHMEAEERAQRNHAQLWGVVNAFWTELCAIQIIELVQYAFGIVSPLLLQRVLVFQEAQDKDVLLDEKTSRAGLIAVGVLVAFGLFTLIFNSQVSFYRARVDTRIMSALKGAVLLRGLESGCQSTDKSKGGALNAYNVLSFDVGPNIQIIWVAMAAIRFPLQLGLALAALFRQVAWSIVPGLVLIIAAKTFVFFCMYYDGCLREQLFRIKDQRLELCNEGFSGIRTLQMLAWTGPFQERILVARDRELRCTALRHWLQKMCNALDSCLVPIVTLTTLGYYVSQGGESLKASVAIPVIGLISALIGPFGQIPGWTNQYLVWRSAYDRVNRFMGLDKGGAPHRAEARDGQWRHGAGQSSVASFNRCSLSWGSTSSTTGVSSGDDAEALATAPLLQQRPQCDLQGIDLQIRSSELLVVVGAAGQGKSSVLAALLGQMHVEEGQLISPGWDCAVAASAASLPENMETVRARLGITRDGQAETSPRAMPMPVVSAIPFAAQVPDLFATTIRANIIFGSTYDPEVFKKVIAACALDIDLAAMPAGDLTEIVSGGASMSGGQRARVSLARAVYRAVLSGQPASLVLLDDPFCALDKKVATQVCTSLLAKPNGLLSQFATVVVTADPWWLQQVTAHSNEAASGCRVAVIRSGCVVADGGFQQICARAAGSGDLPELSALSTHSAALPTPPTPQAEQSWNPQDDEAGDGPAGPSPPVNTSPPMPRKSLEAVTQTPLTNEQKEASRIMRKEVREEGHVRWATYMHYFNGVGWVTMVSLTITLICLMFFDNVCNLWVVYWTTENDDKSKNFMYGQVKALLGEAGALDPNALLWMYAGLVLCLLITNIAGHGLEIVGGISAAGTIFRDSLGGTMQRPLRWWDANPTGRVVNRFSSDVAVMDDSVTNIMGVIFGAVLYFLGHTFVLALAVPASLALVPLVAMLMEYCGRYYRASIREIQRISLTNSSIVYQDMAEAMHSRLTIRAFSGIERTMCQSFHGLDELQRTLFTKTCIGLWVGLRMSMAGFMLSTFSQLHPVFQYFGYMNASSAALVGFSISYSSQIVGIIQQFVTNFSDLEMQLISIERLREFGSKDNGELPVDRQTAASAAVPGLSLSRVEVTYREGIRPALYGINISFAPGEVAMIMGRTGAGKTSLLLSILQLAPYKGTIEVDGRNLREVASDEVRGSLVAIVPQQPLLFEGSLRWNLDPFGQCSTAALCTALTQAGLRKLCTEPGLDGKVAGEGPAADGLALSLGQKQMLCATRVLLRRPRVALLDEVTAALPQEIALNTVQSLLGHLKAQGAAVLLVTHKEELLCCGERLVTVSDGRIVEDRRLPRATA